MPISDGERVFIDSSVISRWLNSPSDAWFVSSSPPVDSIPGLGQQDVPHEGPLPLTSDDSHPRAVASNYMAPRYISTHTTATWVSASGVKFGESVTRPGVPVYMSLKDSSSRSGT